MKTPRQAGESCRGVGWDYLLVEAEAGNIVFLLRKRQAVYFDEVGIVTLGLVEGEGEVPDVVIRITSDSVNVTFSETI